MSEIKEKEYFNIEKFCSWIDSIDWRKEMEDWFDKDKINGVKLHLFFDEMNYDQDYLEFQIDDKPSDHVRKYFDDAKFTLNGKKVKDENKKEEFIEGLLSISILGIYIGEENDDIEMVRLYIYYSIYNSVEPKWEIIEDSCDFNYYFGN